MGAPQVIGEPEVNRPARNPQYRVELSTVPASLQKNSKKGEKSGWHHRKDYCTLGNGVISARAEQGRKEE